MPPLTELPPEYVLAPESNNVPAPLFVRELVPAIVAEKFTVPVVLDTPITVEGSEPLTIAVSWITDTPLIVQLGVVGE